MYATYNSTALPTRKVCFHSHPFLLRLVVSSGPPLTNDNLPLAPTAILAWRPSISVVRRYPGNRDPSHLPALRQQKASQMRSTAAVSPLRPWPAEASYQPLPAPLYCSFCFPLRHNARLPRPLFPVMRLPVILKLS